MVTTLPSSVTLYQDWQRRRERLLSSGAPQGQAYIDVQIKVLDFLLQRYANSPLAGQPPRFPLESVLVFNHRAVVVHHHLSRGKTPGIKTEAESRTRLSTILQRIKNLDPQSDAKAPSNGILISADDPSYRPLNWSLTASDAQKIQVAHANLGMAMSLGSGVYDAMEKALALGPVLPERAIEWLHDRIAENGRVLALDMLARCSNASALDYGFLLWQACLQRDPHDPLIQRLESIFFQEQRREHAAEKSRAALACSSMIVRLRAMNLLQRLGTLDDVGLLMDLLALPEPPDGDSAERAEMLELLENLAKAAPQPAAADRA